METNEFYIPTYIINLKERSDRLKSIKNQFEGKSEFEVNIIEASYNQNGNLGLWNSIRRIVKVASENGDDLILICEDDHQFTDEYEWSAFLKNIIEAHKANCDILSGGIGGFGCAEFFDLGKLKIDWFFCTQFLVVYRRFFQTILLAEFDQSDAVDSKISQLAKVKMVVYPFISTQAEFGYSDVTEDNNLNKGLITQHFKSASDRLKIFSVGPVSSKGNFEYGELAFRRIDAEQIVPIVYDLVKPKTIVDFGCGKGDFLGVFKELGAREILGIDNSLSLDLQREYCKYRVMDLEQPIALKKKYDLAICLEVAEHLQEPASEVLVESLTCASDMILFSAAVPGQGGQDHLNEQWVDYWIHKFAKYSFSFYDLIRREIWNNPNVHWWYKQNVFLILNDTLSHGFSKEPILSLIHPDHYCEKLNLIDHLYKKADFKI